MRKSEQCVAFVGRIPPPFGGVTVHLARLLDRLRKAQLPTRLYELAGKSNAELQIVPASPKPWQLLKFLCFCREAVVHLHTDHISAMMAAAFVLSFRRCRLILTLHSLNPIRWYARVGPIRRFLWRAAASRVAAIICVNRELQEWLVGIGIPVHRLNVLPAFIPPSPTETDPGNIPQEAREFLRHHSPIVATHGWFGFYVEGIHIYSFDLLAPLLERLRESYPNLGLVTVISGRAPDNDHREEIFRLRREKGLEDRWLILEQPFSAAALYAKSDLFLRATVSDGDSISVRECLSLGVPVVASDCVARPEGCFVFQSRDLNSLLSTVCRVLSQASDRAGSSRRVSDHTVAILESIYRRILDEAQKSPSSLSG